MMKSGTHDNDAFNFIQVAMQEFHGFTPITVYYFYTRCEEHSDIDCIFQPTMDESLKGACCGGVYLFLFSWVLIWCSCGVVGVDCSVVA